MKNKLLCIILSCLLLTGCAPSDSSDDGEWQVQVDALPLPSGILRTTAQCVLDDRIYVGGMAEDHIAAGYTAKDGTTGNLNLPDGFEFIYAISPHPTGVALLAGTLPYAYYDAGGTLKVNETVEGALSILEFDTSGECVKQFPLPTPYCETGMIWKQMFFTEDGYLLVCQDMIVKLDQTGQEINRLAANEAKFFGACEAAGDLMVCQYDLDGEDSELLTVDMVNLTVSRELPLPQCIALGVGVALDGRLMIYDEQPTGNKLSYLDEQTGVTTTEFKMDEIGLSEVACSTIVPYDGGFFVSGPYQTELYIVRYVYGKTNERKQLILAVDYGGHIMDMVDYFNTHNKEYRIVVKEYGNGEAPSWDTLRMEISSGKGPDMFAFEFGSPFTLGDEYVLEDLMPYLENDPEYGPETFVPSFLNALRESDGGLKWLPRGMAVWTFTAPEHILSHAGATPEQLNEAFENQDTYERIFPYWMDKTELWSWGARTVSACYVDRAAGTCQLDSEEVLSLLQMCDQWGNPTMLPTEDRNQTIFLDTREGFLGLETLTFPRMPFLNYLYQGVPYQYVGFPTYHGNGGFFAPEFRLGICSQSSNKEGAWEFLRLAMDNRFSQCADTQGTTAVQAQMETILQGMVRRSAENPDPEFVFTQEDMDKYLEFVENTSIIMDEDEIVIKILREEGERYFAGNCTAEQAVAAMQSRVSLYLAEQS